MDGGVSWLQVTQGRGRQRIRDLEHVLAGFCQLDTDLDISRKGFLSEKMPTSD